MNAFDWWCEDCQCDVPGEHVTFQERHDERAGGCGCRVVPWEDRAIKGWHPAETAPRDGKPILFLSSAFLEYSVGRWDGDCFDMQCAPPLAPFDWWRPLEPPPKTHADRKEGAVILDMCQDCPPQGYPTDETRCLPCPRRGGAA